MATIERLSRRVGGKRKEELSGAWAKDVGISVSPINPWGGQKKEIEERSAEIYLNASKGTSLSRGA